VEADEAVGGQVAARLAGGLEPGFGTDQVGQDVADGVVRGALDPAVGREAGELAQPGHESPERRGDDGGVTVDAGEVGQATGRGSLELLGRGVAALGPVGLVPALAHDHGGVRRRPGMLGQRVEAGRQARKAGEVEAAAHEAGADRVDVGVGEARGDESAAQVDDLVGPRPGLGLVLTADERDPVVLPRHGCRPLVGPVREDRAVAQQHAGHRPVRPSNRRRTPSWARSSSRAYAAWPGT
jgi:hypothetical protein